MKRVFLIIVLALMPFSVSAQSSENFQLEGRIASQANLTSENFSLALNISTKENMSSPGFRLISEIISAIGRIIVPQPTQAPSAPQQPAATGGGGGGLPVTQAATQAVKEPKADFRLSLEKITERLNAKEQKVIEIDVENTGEIDIRMEVVFEGELKTHIVADKNSFDLKKGSKETVRLKIIAPDTPGNILIGDIVFKGARMAKRVPTTIIAIALEEKLLDLRVEVAMKEIFAGEEIGAQITIFNLGRAGRVDLVLEYSVAGENVLASGKETLAVETQTSVYRTLRVPDNAEPGRYIFRAAATYGNQSTISEDEFSVTERALMSPFLLALIGIVLILMVYISLSFLVRRLPKLKRKKK